MKLNIFKRKKEDANKKSKNVAEPQVKIVIKKLMGGKIPITINEFLALQKKDESGNFVYINEEQNFLEDASIIQDKAIQELEERLNISDETPIKKLEILDKKIKLQEKLVKSMKDGYSEIELDDKKEKVLAEDKTKVNSIEERKLLIQLRVLRNVVMHPKEGAFEEINSEGYRQITYMHDDGLLIPYFHSAPTVTMYPAISTRKKYYKADQDLINQDYIDENKSYGGVWFRSIMLIIFVILFLGNMYWTFQINERANESMLILDNSAFTELVKNSEYSAIQCAYYLATITETNAEFINFAKNQLNITDNQTEKIGDLR